MWALRTYSAHASAHNWQGRPVEQLFCCRPEDSPGLHASPSACALETLQLAFPLFLLPRLNLLRHNSAGLCGQGQI